MAVVPKSLSTNEMIGLDDRAQDRLRKNAHDPIRKSADRAQ